MTAIRDEVYVLLLVATLGAAVLVASSHFASFFLGLELLSVSLYGLIAYLRARPRPVEAGIKYLVLAAASAAFLLFGMALVYARQRHDGVRPDGGAPGRDVARDRWLAAARHGPDRAASASSWRWCRSTCGRRTSTKARPRR